MKDMPIKTVIDDVTIMSKFFTNELKDAAPRKLSSLWKYICHIFEYGTAAYRKNSQMRNIHMGMAD